MRLALFEKVFVPYLSSRSERWGAQMLEKKSHLKHGAMTLGITAISLMTLSLTTLQITRLIMKNT
jgi:hypothetical protein